MTIGSGILAVGVWTWASLVFVSSGNLWAKTPDSANPQISPNTDRSRSAAAKRPELELRTDYLLSSDPLTVDKIWNIDPDQKNKHLQRWMLYRPVELMDLSPVKMGTDLYGIQVLRLVSHTKGYIRDKGPWFKSIADFPCEKTPGIWFDTSEGAQYAVGEASDRWAHLLEIEKTKLSILLSRVRGRSEQSAVSFANLVFKRWLKEVDEIWRVEEMEKIRQEVWKFYKDQAESAEVCEKMSSQPPGQNSGGARFWRSMMEPFVGEPPKVPQLLARAPARLWDGLFSVRVSVEIGGKYLNGRFLIDSGSQVSVLSPTWLEGQGIHPVWIEIPGAPYERVSWSGLWKGERPLAKRATVDGISFSGFTMPLHEFLLAETDFFSPPDHVGSCCDGILGADFLRMYPVEFQSISPAEVRVWPRENFHWSDDTPWLELSELANGDWASSCAVVPDFEAHTQEKLQLPGVRWDLGSDSALEIHSPWQKAASTAKPNLWDVICDSTLLGHAIPADFPKPPRGQSSGRDSGQNASLNGGRDTARSGGPDAARNGGRNSRRNVGRNADGPLTSRVPAVSLGMPFLARGNFTVDLPHGRLWLGKGTFSRPISPSNSTGLSLVYIAKKNGRELRVQKIAPRSSAQGLAKLGLRAGMLITQIDRLTPGEIDLWEVERHLAGVYGKTVVLQWATPKGLKVGSIEITD